MKVIGIIEEAKAVEIDDTVVYKIITEYIMKLFHIPYGWYVKNENLYVWWEEDVEGHLKNRRRKIRELTNEDKAAVLILGKLKDTKHSEKINDISKKDFI